ncbi:uncharacterized protein LOC122257990 [Penaeus japonicus]|uniref:uncharacterized protein LOC122257990 n=1 Tax=Penaeus japonicus TaxID=27405 RepID=UPI001C711755|nr:uncharacterized protein LOC122257990 [Penaeus japonicus]
MKLLMLSVFAVTALAAPQGYRLQEPGFVSEVSSGISSETGVSVNNVGIATDIGVSTGVGLNTIPGESGVISNPEPSVDVGIVTDTNLDAECQEGEVRHVDGSCVVPEITRKVFVFSVPKQQREPIDSIVDLPPPKVEHNILFVRLPEGGVGPEPIVVPPPRQENIIYVLNKQGEHGQRVIEVPAHPPSEPEIYFVNYEEGENPTLPGGLDLQTALGSAAEASGQLIGNTRLSNTDGNTEIDTVTANGQISSQFGSGLFSTGTDTGVRNNVNEELVTVQADSPVDFYSTP